VTFAVIAVFIAVFGAVYYVGVGVLRSRSSDRLASLQRTREDILGTSFSERAVGPLVDRLGRWAIRFTPVGWGARTERRLLLAGWENRYDRNSWAAIRLLSVAGAVLVWLVVQSFVTGFWARVLFFAVILFMGIFLPNGILNRRIEDRRDAMRKELPDIMDLLVISVEAGLSFEGALNRVVATVPGIMADEFNRALAETRVGVTRAAALKHLVERTDLDELRTFVLALNQAETFGVSIARVLRVQADELRVRRRQRAQELAFRAPVKLVFPLLFCILPALFVVLLGPAAIEIFENIID
jgi:tight adherence protein C